MEPVTVVVVDDHAIVRHGLCTYFSTQPDLRVVGEAGSGEEAALLVASLRPDVVLMDLVLPGIDGVEATRRVRAAAPSTRVIVLTSFADDGFVFPALRAGASSYLLKDAHPGEVADAVRRVARGGSVVHPAVAARLVERVREPRPLASLTARELEVLRLVAGGEGNAAIARRLGISERTVKKHVSNVLGKLEVADRTQAAALAWREGLMGVTRGDG